MSENIDVPNLEPDAPYPPPIYIRKPEMTVSRFIRDFRYRPNAADVHYSTNKGRVRGNLGQKSCMADFKFTNRTFVYYAHVDENNVSHYVSYAIYVWNREKKKYEG
ncbi:hypothetical protein GGI11_004340 [Coemansia sp. RSA 2049]|nr:hypothetical protein GGI11_004340 [Coemansia sp. RSA 2049]